MLENEEIRLFAHEKPDMESSIKLPMRKKEPFTKSMPLLWDKANEFSLIISFCALILSA